MPFGWTALRGLVAAVAALLVARPLWHILQLESYQFYGYFKSCLRRLKAVALPGLLISVPLFLDTLLAVPAPVLHLLLLTAAMGLAWLIRRRQRSMKEKKPFVVTARVRRLLAVSAAAFVLIAWGLSALAPWRGALFPALLPLWVAVGAALAWPVEKLIQQLYFRDAQRMLRKRDDLIKIGITGSYGKTSVKFILATILEEKYQVLATPASFNTPMGLTRVIREQLTPTHQVFLAEMGARHVGEIAELCRLVHPRYGVLTAVGPQHLDTFHTLDNIIRTKYAIMEAVPEDGCCFFADDGDICRRLYDRTNKNKRIVSLTRPEGEQPDVYAEDMTVSAEGSCFTLCSGGEKIACRTLLLGEHAIQNILLAASVAAELGLKPKEIARGIAKLRPVEHRLQLIHRGEQIWIDDAFNSNPRGAAAALRVLKAFSGRRVLVTPGMVELGAEEAELNRAFGRQAAESADEIILVGPRHTRPIAEGIREKGFGEEHLHVAVDLNEAIGILSRIGRPGDVVLLENDLPDHYTE